MCRFGHLLIKSKNCHKNEELVKCIKLVAAEGSAKFIYYFFCIKMSFR